MSDSSPIAPLKVADEAFLVSSIIEPCPKTMMIRELIVTRLEAAAHAASAKRQVVIGPRLHEGTRTPASGIPALASTPSSCIRSSSTLLIPPFRRWSLPYWSRWALAYMERKAAASQRKAEWALSECLSHSTHHHITE